MKAKIISALKTKYSNRGFSDKAYDGVADFLSKTVTEETQIEDAVVGVDGLLKAFQGEVDKVRGEKTAIQKELDELKVKGDDKGEGATVVHPKNEDDKTPEWAKALLESNKKLSERLNTIEGEKVVSARQKQIDAVVGKLPESLRKPYSRVAISSEMSDEDFTNYMADVEAEVDAIVQDNSNNGLGNSPKPKGGSGGKDALDPALQERINERKAETVAPAIAGLPTKQ